MERTEITADGLWEIACGIAQRQPRWIREDARQAAALAGLEALRSGWSGTVVWMRMARAALREKRRMERPVPRGDMPDPQAITCEVRDFILDMTPDELVFTDTWPMFPTVERTAEELGWTKYKVRHVRAELRRKWEE